MLAQLVELENEEKDLAARVDGNPNVYERLREDRKATPKARGKTLPLDPESDPPLVPRSGGNCRFRDAPAHARLIHQRIVFDYLVNQALLVKFRRVFLDAPCADGQFLGHGFIGRPRTPL